MAGKVECEKLDEVGCDPLLMDLFTAYYDARKNKRNTQNQLRFEINLEQNIFTLYRAIKDRTYKPQDSIAFVVYKPVTREVFAAAFADRVIHHLFYNYVNPIFERTFIFDSYSCRKGKGTSFGIKRLEYSIRSCSANYTRDCYVMKLDIRGFFMNINRNILFQKVKETLLRYSSRRGADGTLWKEKLDYDLILYLARVIIFDDPTTHYIMKGKVSDWDKIPHGKSLFDMPEECGLPIGNLTSQLFSNIYLNDFDHFVKRQLKARYYGRYVDDFYLVDQCKEVLTNYRKVITTYLKDKLGLEVHPLKIYLQKYDKGVLFVGGFVKPYRTYVNNRVKSNFSQRIYALKKENITAGKLEMTVNSYLGSMRAFRSFNIRRKIMKHNTWLFRYGAVQNCCSVFHLDENIGYNQVLGEFENLSASPLDSLESDLNIRSYP